MTEAADRIETMETMLQCMADGRIVMLADRHRGRRWKRTRFGLARQSRCGRTGIRMTSTAISRCLRIEALEAALREIEAGFPGSYQPKIDMVKTARTALAPEQNK